jgi:hypothetical protein
MFCEILFTKQKRKQKYDLNIEKYRKPKSRLWLFVVAGTKTYLNIRSGRLNTPSIQ